ncbi:hypothetical protein [Modestobacter sp. NPDC049651]|uniref:D-alanyl-D-alanine carboxypeptidase family protein n=1 Tax=unclassified Modestobacter TaxID=2643866 RepID=UPI0033C90031
MTDPQPTRTPRFPRPLPALLAVLLAGSVIAGSAVLVRPAANQDRAADRVAAPAPAARVPSVDWPAQGQAAYTTSATGVLRRSGPEQPVPIASVTKVMTAHVVLRAAPLRPGESGPVIRLTAADVADTERRRAAGESVVRVEAGEELTELQALQALLLPSANNIAVVLARHTAGSVEAFVRRMNEAARELGMSGTTYRDPSGIDAGTVSTAADQVRLFDAAMADPVFAAVAGSRTAELPVAGTVRSTNTLLGQDGFVAGKTGSHDAAGGCLVFRVVREVDGRRVTVTGAVLGQRGGPLVPAALAAARDLAAQVVTGPDAAG